MPQEVADPARPSSCVRVTAQKEGDKCAPSTPAIRPLFKPVDIVAGV
jgi:hypothetical protein